MQHNLLKDESEFVGSGWASVRSSETCLLTTDSRLFVHGSEVTSWVLGVTQSRFSFRASFVRDDIVLGVRGTKTSQKLVKYVIDTPNEVASVDLEESNAVTDIIAFAGLDVVLVVFENGASECRSLETLERSGSKLSPIKSLLKGTRVLCLKQLDNTATVLIVCYSTGQASVLRVIPEENGRVMLDQDILQLGSLDDPLYKAASVSQAMNGPILINFFSANANASGQCGVVGIAVDPVSLTKRMDSNIIFSVPAGVMSLIGVLGGRILGFNITTAKLELYDAYYGILLNSWTVESITEVKALNVSPSGRAVSLLTTKQARMVIVNLDPEPLSLARALSVGFKRPVQGMSSQEPASGKQSKRQRKDSVASITASPPSTSVRRLADRSAKCVMAYQNRAWDVIEKLVEQGDLISLRLLGDDSALVEIVKACKIDLCVQLLRSCADVTANQVTFLIRFLLKFASGMESNKSLLKALDAFGSGLYKSTSLKNVDKAVVHLLAETLTARSLVESEFLQSLSRSIKSPEEVAALTSSLVFAIRNSSSLEMFDTLLRSLSLPLDARSGLELNGLIWPAFASLKQTVLKEVATCDQLERVAQTARHALDQAGKDKDGHRRQGSNSHYRVETIRL